MTIHSSRLTLFNTSDVNTEGDLLTVDITIKNLVATSPSMTDMRRFVMLIERNIDKLGSVLLLPDCDLEGPTKTPP